MQASGQLTQPLVLKSIPKVGKAVSKNTFKNKLKSKKNHQHQNNNKKPNQHQKTLPAPKLTSIWFFFFCSLFFNVCFTVEKLLQTTGLKILVNSWGWHVLPHKIKWQKELFPQLLCFWVWPKETDQYFGSQFCFWFLKCTVCLKGWNLSLMPTAIALTGPWELGPPPASQGKADAAANMCCLTLGRHRVTVFCRGRQAGNYCKLFNGAMHQEK